MHASLQWKKCLGKSVVKQNSINKFLSLFPIIFIPLPSNFVYKIRETVSARRKKSNLTALYVYSCLCCQEDLKWFVRIRKTVTGGAFKSEKGFKNNHPRVRDKTEPGTGLFKKSKIMTSAQGGTHFGSKLPGSPPSANGITPKTQFAYERLGRRWKRSGWGWKIQGSLANSFSFGFLWEQILTYLE